ncbi:MAG TPA: cbb3-type cytochrome c oxidase N-terminal domain-containing protein [Chitinophagaceae bacterium]
MRNSKFFSKSFLRFSLASAGVMLGNLVFAADGPTPSSMSSPLAITMIIIMVILLLIIALLANLLLGAAGFYTDKVKKEEQQQSSAPVTTVVIAGMLLCSFPAMAQDAGAKTASSLSFGGLSGTAFYIMSAVIFLEIIVILGLLLNLRILIAKEKMKSAVVAPVKVRKTVNWWNKLNKFRPVHEEGNIDLGHNYDGIRELDNRLPPWWLYGFYITIIFAGIYLWRYHVSHTAPSSEEEYQIAMAKADRQKEAYLKKTAANVDENTVKYMADAAELSAGQKVYQMNCSPCHGKAGEGTVGPNLTDDYWLHGGSIKDIFKTIKYGVPEKGMKSWKDDFSPKQLAQLSSFITSLKGTNPPNAKEKQGDLFKDAPANDSASKKSVASSAP